jgi:hypothetical protein
MDCPQSSIHRSFESVAIGNVNESAPAAECRERIVGEQHLLHRGLNHLMRSPTLTPGLTFEAVQDGTVNTDRHSLAHLDNGLRTTEHSVTPAA